MIRLQTIIFSEAASEARDLYYRGEGADLNEGHMLCLKAGARVSMDTYMNAFDLGTWFHYAGQFSLYLKVRISGRGRIRLIHRDHGQLTVMESRGYDSESAAEILLSVPGSAAGGIIYPEIEAASDSVLHEGAFITDHHTGAEITLGMVICTYKRKDCILQHTDKLRKSLFFRPESDLYGKLLVCIVDNASELPRQDEGLLRLVHHPNTGGSGGFARGMQELRRISEEKKISHVILMDDDAEVTEESLYRLYALLAMARGSCRERPVAGRMFRMDLRQVQYTAAEVWNGGDLRHIGYSCDMTDPEALTRMNDPGEAQYGGWWFCCYPMSFVKDNDPLPFFIHCDDVEYGLRYGQQPVILNGIQVWHETYEHRQSPVMHYYDTRNPLIVNALYKSGQDAETIKKEWFEKITGMHNAGDALSEYMCIRAMLDFLKGPAWVFGQDVGKRHQKLVRKQKAGRYMNSLLWRYTKALFDRDFTGVIRRYETYVQRYRRKD